MATKRTRRKAEGRNIIVNVKVGGETKPKRKRRAPRRKTTVGTSSISPIGRTEVSYLPPLYTPSPAQVLPQVYPLQAQQPNVSGLLEDVKRERTNLLKDIERQTEQQIVQYVGKQQGAEQRSELARMDAFDPFSTKQYAQPSQPLDQVATAKQPPSLKAMMKPERPSVEEPDEALPFANYFAIEDITPTEEKKQKKPRLKVVEKLQPPPDIGKIDETPAIKQTVPEPTIAETIPKIQTTGKFATVVPPKMSEPAEKKRGSRANPFDSGKADRNKYYTDVLRSAGFPKQRDDIPEWRQQIADIYETLKRQKSIPKGLTKEMISNYYGSNVFKGRSGIPTVVMEENPISQSTAKMYNLSA